MAVCCCDKLNTQPRLLQSFSRPKRLKNDDTFRPDQVWNVVGVCPNDHRRAHFGDDRIAMQKVFLEFLITKYPGAASALETISVASNIIEG